MAGNERFDLIGKLLTNDNVRELMAQCRGLSYNWDCIAKARLVREMMGRGRVMVGSCYVISTDGRSAYGHDFRPPLEMHAWWQPSTQAFRQIVDIALPGLIDKGLRTRDNQGFFIVGRPRVVLAGAPPCWVRYTAREVFG